MAQVEIYTQAYCGYCMRAKRLLDDKGVTYTEHDVSGREADRAAMVKRANGCTTVPQIFIDDHHVGGSDDLMALERAGRLDALLETVA